MKKVFDARLYVYSIGLLISSAVERIITSVINEHMHLGAVPYHAVSIVILFALFILTNILLKPFTQKEFITRAVLGKKYIGGRWVEIVLTEHCEISHVTKMDITYDDDKINIHGDCYQSGQYKYYFDSVCVSMVNYDLTYVFIAREGSNTIREDIGHLRFEPNVKRRFDKYYGNFEDKGKSFRVAAILVEDKAIIQKMDCDFIGAVEQDVLPELIRKHRLNACPAKITSPEPIPA